MDDIIKKHPLRPHLVQQAVFAEYLNPITHPDAKGNEDPQLYYMRDNIEYVNITQPQNDGEYMKFVNNQLEDDNWNSIPETTYEQDNKVDVDLNKERHHKKTKTFLDLIYGDRSDDTMANQNIRKEQQEEEDLNLGIGSRYNPTTAEESEFQRSSVNKNAYNRQNFRSVLQPDRNGGELAFCRINDQAWKTVQVDQMLRDKRYNGMVNNSIGNQLFESYEDDIRAERIKRSKIRQQREIAPRIKMSSELNDEMRTEGFNRKIISMWSDPIVRTQMKRKYDVETLKDMLDKIDYTKLSGGYKLAPDANKNQANREGFRHVDIKEGIDILQNNKQRNVPTQKDLSYIVKTISESLNLEDVTEARYKVLQSYVPKLRNVHYADFEQLLEDSKSNDNSRQRLVPQDKNFQDSLKQFLEISFPDNTSSITRYAIAKNNLMKNMHTLTLEQKNDILALVNNVEMVNHPSSRSGPQQRVNNSTFVGSTFSNSMEQYAKSNANMERDHLLIAQRRRDKYSTSNEQTIPMRTKVMQRGIALKPENTMFDRYID